jgi:serine protease Do
MHPSNSACRSFLYWFSIIVSFSFFSCATILSPEKGPNILGSEPSGAEVLDDNNKVLGTTPFDMAKVGQNVKFLKIRKDGYREAGFQVGRQPKRGLIFMDAFFLCIPCVIDFPNGSLYKVTPKNGVVKLRKQLEEHDNTIRVAIDKPTVAQQVSANVGKVNGRMKTLDDKGMNRYLGGVDDLDETILTAMKDSYLLPVYLYSNENAKSSMLKAKLIFRPVITAFTFDMKGDEFVNATGPASLTCSWNMYKASNKNNLIGTISTTTSLHRMKGTKVKILEQLMHENVLDFMENDTLYKFLQRQEVEYLADSKGTEFKLTAPLKNKYATSKEILKAAKSGVVTVLMKDGFGSGIIISDDGYILTNYHVIEGEKSIQVKLNADVKLKATLIKSNSDYDLALIKIEAEDLKALSMGNSELAEVGDDVWAIGTPLETSFGQTITKGIISGVRKIGGIDFIQTDVSINAGNSGGPLINDQGEVIGITTMKAAGQGVEGMGFCIPSNSAIEMLNIKF